jgi:pSer/pThr/pTyr-binding forkhead associated (FHA) protein
MIVRKLLVSDGRTEREVLLVGTIVVGRDPSCQLTDLDPLLSRRHAEFVPTSKGVTVRDLKSRNGILVNGDKVPEHALKPGDVIQLGHLHVRYLEEPVVKSPEDHSRAHAKTETGIDVPTVAAGPQAVSPVPASPAALAPTEAAPAVTSSTAEFDTTPPARGARSGLDRHSANQGGNLDATVAPFSRSAARTPSDDDTGETRAPASRSGQRAPSGRDDTFDADATIVLAPHRPASPVPAPAPVSKSDDVDETRVPWTKAAAAADEPDATVATSSNALDETRAPGPRPLGQTARPGPATEARVVANMSMVVTEASPSCQTVIGARPDTIVGGQLSDAITRSLRFVATGDGPSALSLSIARETSKNMITVIFKTGTGNHS